MRTDARLTTPVYHCAICGERMTNSADQGGSITIHIGADVYRRAHLNCHIKAWQAGERMQNGSAARETGHDADAEQTEEAWL
jgi:hypothetical protein